MQKFIGLILIILFFASCSSKKNANTDEPIGGKDIIPEAQMIEIMTDMHLVESAISVSQGKGKNHSMYAFYYYKNILNKYNISKTKLEKSIYYYAFDVKKMDKIYTEVITNLNTK